MTSLKNILFAFFGFTVVNFSLLAQKNATTYQSNIVNVGEIQMEYYDHCGTGPLFIDVRDFHNYYEGPVTGLIPLVLTFWSNSPKAFMWWRLCEEAMVKAL